MISVSNIIDDLERHPYKRYRSRSIDEVDKIIIHHSATKNGTARGFARYHVNNLDWPAVGYHLIGDRTGLHLCNSLDTISYHCSGNNRKSIGICRQGNFDLRPPTDNEYWDIIQMVIWVDREIGRPLPIHYHTEYSSKTCPGSQFDKEYFEKELKQFRWLLTDYVE